MGRKNQNPNPNDYLKFRHTYIHEADRIMADCMTFTAADFYRRAGLGLRAIVAWEGAAKCFEVLRMPDDHERCRLKSVSIPIYYEEVNDDRA